MAYRRKTYRRGGYRKKRAYRPKSSFWRAGLKYGTMGLAKVGLKMLKKRLGLNTENKNWDTNISQAFTGTVASALQPTSGLAQGNTNETRSGNGLRITHWNLRGALISQAANLDAQRCRIIITLQPKVTTAGDYLNASELLEVTGDIDSFYNSNLQNCKILFDKVYILRPQVTGAITQVPWRFKWSPSYDDGHVQWTDADTTGSVANQLQGLLRVWIMTDAASNRAQCTAASRIHFVDN